MREHKPITHHRVRQEIQFNIAYQSFHPLVVSEYECREAALFAGYTWIEFASLDTFDRATCIAHFRMNGIIKSNVDEIISDYQKAQAARPHR